MTEKQMIVEYANNHREATKREIATALNLPIQTVRTVCKRERLDVIGRRKQTEPDAESKTAKMIDYYLEHPEITVREIARKFGSRETTIYNAMRHYGISERRRPDLVADKIKECAEEAQKENKMTISFETIDEIQATKNAKVIFELIKDTLQKDKDYTVGRGNHIEVTLSGYIAMTKMYPSLSIDAIRDVSDMFIMGIEDECKAQFNTDVVRYTDVEQQMNDITNAVNALKVALKGNANIVEEKPKPMPMAKAFPTTKMTTANDLLGKEEAEWLQKFENRIQAILKRDKITMRKFDSIMLDYLYTPKGIYLDHIIADFYKSVNMEKGEIRIPYHVAIASDKIARSAADAIVSDFEKADWYQNTDEYRHAKARGKVVA